MKRHLVSTLLALALLCLVPASASAVTYSFDTPFASGTVTGDIAPLNGTSPITAEVSLSVDPSNHSASASGTINGQSFSGSFNWTDLLNFFFLNF